MYTYEPVSASLGNLGLSDDQGMQTPCAMLSKTSHEVQPSKCVGWLYHRGTKTIHLSRRSTAFCSGYFDTKHLLLCPPNYVKVIRSENETPLKLGAEVCCIRSPQWVRLSTIMTARHSQHECLGKYARLSSITEVLKTCAEKISSAPPCLSQ